MGITRISVVVRFFSAAPVLEESMRSALNKQELNRISTLSATDSTDNSLPIAHAFQPLVRILTGPNRGVSGLGETTGGWTVFPDADDLLVSRCACR